MCDSMIVKAIEQAKVEAKCDCADKPDYPFEPVSAKALRERYGDETSRAVSTSPRVSRR